MTKNIFILLLWLLPLSAFSQQLITVSGTVTDIATGTPVPNVSVYISTDTTVLGVYNNTVTTNASGFYTDTFGPPANQGVISVVALDCNGAGVVGYATYTVIPGAIPTITLNLQICTVNGGGCNAAYSYSIQGDTLMATNLSSGSSPTNSFSSTWTLYTANGVVAMTSTQTNPVFNNLSNGTYLLCLDIVDSVGACSANMCDSMAIGGATSCNAAFNANLVSPCTFQFNLIQNNVVAVVQWVYGDGTLSSGSNTVTTHTYNASGTYLVTCSVADPSGVICDSDSMMITVTCGGVINYISGNISKPTPAGSMPASADVYLIEYDAVSGILTAIDTTRSDSFGDYTFYNVAPGTYRIKAALVFSDPDYANYLPTYYGSVLLWNQAVSVNQNSSNVNIGLLMGVNPGGPGFIGGLVFQGANKTTDVGDPLADLMVLLTDMSDGPVAYTQTDINGQYSFANLAYGTYKVWIDVLNKSCTPLVITISPASSSVINADLEVNSTFITGIFTRDLDHLIEVYPNPSQGSLNINLKDMDIQNITVQIIDIAGKVQMERGISGKNSTLSIEDLPAGRYFLILKSGSGNYTQKLVKQ